MDDDTKQEHEVKANETRHILIRAAWETETHETESAAATSVAD